VTRAIVRAPIAQLASGERSLGGSIGHYLGRVLRLRAGSTFVAFDPATGDEADAVIVRTDGDSLAVRFGPLRAARALSARGLTWVQGLAKANKCDAIVRDSTELGATRIVVTITSRSVVRLDDARAAARQTRWARIAREATRQCGRSEAPVVDPPVEWGEALARADESGGARFCLWEHATEPLAPGLLEALAEGAPLAFACGPEGGLEDAEVDLARSRGWRVVSLGPLALRTETVAAAVLGAVSVWAGLQPGARMP
jgi:16S rRNA (uracil1498-N3)-methyltransferase